MGRMGRGTEEMTAIYTCKLTITETIPDDVNMDIFTPDNVAKAIIDGFTTDGRVSVEDITVTIQGR